VDGVVEVSREVLSNKKRKTSSGSGSGSGSSSRFSTPVQNHRSSERLASSFRTKLQRETVTDLKWMLRRNHQALGGNKKELIERILDRQKNGCIPLCQKLPTGDISATLTPQNDGTFTCSGHYKNGKRVNCRYKGKLKRDAFDCHIIKMQNDDCPICLEKIRTDLVTKKCGHSYHLACLNMLKKYSNKCAICRERL